MHVREDDAKAGSTRGSARIQPVIDALVAFESEVHRQVAELARRAEAAEREIQSRSEAASAANALVEEARNRAAKITELATNDARELLRRAQSDVDALHLDSQRELIAAFRQYLQNIDAAQSTLLRIARRALSALVADLGEEPESESASESQPSSPTPVAQATGPVAGAAGIRQAPTKRRAPDGTSISHEPRQAERDSRLTGSSHENGAHQPTKTVPPKTTSRISPETEDKRRSVEESQPPTETPAVLVSGPEVGAGRIRKAPPKRRALNKRPTTDGPRQPERDSRLAESSHENGSQQPAQTVSPATTLGISPEAADVYLSPHKLQAQRDQGTEPGHGSEKPRGSEPEYTVAGEEAGDTLPDTQDNLIDLRNRRDLERLDEQSGPIMRAISRRRANGTTRDL